MTFPGFTLARRRCASVLVGAYLALTRTGIRWRSTPPHEWMQRWLGERVYDALWRPMLVGKFGEENLQAIVNMAWLWARLKSRTTRLGHLRGRLPGVPGPARRARARAGRDDRCSTRRSRSSTSNRRRHRHRRRRRAGPLVSTPSSPPRSPALMARLAPRSARRLRAKLTGLKIAGRGGAGHRPATSASPTTTGTTCPRKPASRSWRWSSTPTSCRPSTTAATTSSTAATTCRPDHEYFQLSQGGAARALPAVAHALQPGVRPQLGEGSWLWRTAYAQPVPPRQPLAQHPAPCAPRSPASTSPA